MTLGKTSPNKKIDQYFMQKNIFYISGRGGNFTTGLGKYLATKANELDGLGLSNEFLSQEFETQLDIISKMIISADAKKTIFIANSYGAYLLMHALFSKDIELSKLILISPILGSSYYGNRFFKPPYSRRLNELMSGTGHKLPKDTTVIWGTEDNGIDQNAIQKLSFQCIDIKLIEINEQKHDIDKRILAKTLDRILD